jgi:hypothetical protein
VHFDLHQSAYDLDKKYGKDWDRATLTRMANDPMLDRHVRAKLVEIMLLRGASNDLPYAVMQNLPADFNLGGRNSEELHEKAAYQLAAVNAVVAGGAPVFMVLRTSGDQLPSGRVPATELMNVMFQEGGVYGSYEDRQTAEKWMKSMDPGTRGAMMYHIADAAEMSDLGSRAQVNGFEVSAGPVGFGLQWDTAKDTHWKEAGKDIETALASQLKMNPAEKQAFYEGYVHTDNHLENPRDYATPAKGR